MAHTDGPDPDPVEALLPWYAAGTLDRAETAQVEAALARDPALRHQLALAREEMDEAVADAEAMGAPHPRALEQLFTRIAAEPRRTSRWRLLDLGALFDRFSSRSLGWALAAAALLVAVQAGLLLRPMGGMGGMGGTGGAAYRTASAELGPAREGTTLLVAFQPGATASTIAAALQDAGATIVDGPRAGGLYRLRIGPANLDRSAADGIADRLRANRAVVQLVLPASG